MAAGLSATIHRNFLVDEDALIREIHVVLNWFEEWLPHRGRRMKAGSTNLPTRLGAATASPSSRWPRKDDFPNGSRKWVTLIGLLDLAAWR